MKNEKGVTLSTVIITVIVSILIASTSIIVGNKLILDAKKQKQEENYQAVVAAVKREIAKINTSGIISPGIQTYIGTPNPIIGRDASGNVINAGEDWYLLDSNHLMELGIEDIDNDYLVNYKLEVIIDKSQVEDLVEEINKYNEESPSI